MRWLNAIVVTLILLVAICLGIRSFREFDLWILLRTGQWIAENKSFIRSDFFSFTFEGENWTHFKYGYSLVLHFVNKFFGKVEHVFLLQSFYNVIILVLQYSILKELLGVNFKKRLVLLFSAGAILTLFICEYRMNARPEWITYVFSTFYILIGLKGLQKNSNYYYLLIPFQVLWVNMHDGFVVGMAIIVLLIALSFVKRKEVSLFKPLLPLFLILLVSVINPYTFQAFVYPLNIFSQLSENKFTHELHNILSPVYWQQWQSFAFSVLVIMLFVLSYFTFKRLKREGTIRNSHVFFLLILAAFFFLSLKASRNIPLFTLLAVPFLIYLIVLKSHLLIPTALSFVISISLLIGSYFIVVTNTYYKMIDSRIRYGLHVDEYNIPGGAAEYIKHHNLNGKGFTDYLSSAYFIHNLYPQYQSFIDMRDLDVFSIEHFELYNEAVTRPQNFDKLNAVYHFKYVCLYTNDNFYLNFYLYNHQDWRLAYLDGNSAIYLPKGEKTAKEHSDLTEVKEYVKIGAHVIDHLSLLFYPGYKGAGNLNSSEYNYLLSKYFQRVGDINKSIYRARIAVEGNELYESNILLGKLLLQKSNYEKQNQSVLLKEAEGSFKKAILLDEKKALAYKGLGYVYLSTKKLDLALDNFNLASNHSNDLEVDSLIQVLRSR